MVHFEQKKKLKYNIIYKRIARTLAPTRSVLRIIYEGRRAELAWRRTTLRTTMQKKKRKAKNEKQKAKHEKKNKKTKTENKKRKRKMKNGK